MVVDAVRSPHEVLGPDYCSESMLLDSEELAGLEPAHSLPLWFVALD